MHTHNTYNSILPKGVKRCTRLIPDIAHCHAPVSINSCPCILKIGYHFKSCCQTSPQTLLWLQGTTLLLILSSIFFWLPLRIHAVHYLSFTLGPFFNATSTLHTIGPNTHLIYGHIFNPNTILPINKLQYCRVTGQHTA